ncbi:ATP-dependent helicase dcl2 [Aspergillus avenaceus]|uniref:ATP-dependent helicase dcl2 n=1 Tax=Aspergillus avenaceus TaxID=36643 RepID=A0A5N6U489_ASPAV|nr:ATP-dependent helicase dcl2 [Aspergillus avenaceus]
MATHGLSSGDGPLYQTRSYQYEMFEASLKENIIVAMDTGSGKTHIALLRIAHELESSNSQKLIWFLAPTVALCLQQLKQIETYLPAVRACTLTGLDNVDLWKDQKIWDGVLKDKHVVVSTHMVLLDALSHGFVKLSQLGLLIFDEAHHCMRRHPANLIMQGFYHPTVAKFGKDSVPPILGLTASPVHRSSREELKTVEANLAAICKTPCVHRQELLKHTHRPHLKQLWYTPLDDLYVKSESLQALLYVHESADIESDPYIKQLRRSPWDGQTLLHTLATGKTYCRDQMRRFVERSQHIYQELGEWAADYYISASVEVLQSNVHEALKMGWTEQEKSYLVALLSTTSKTATGLASVEETLLSPKLEALLNLLDDFNSSEFSGLIFVKQRATAWVMARFLSLHPRTKSRFRCAPYVGWSNSVNRKDILGDLLSTKMQKNTLDEFRSGHKNLIVATDVLEEGIDVSACSVVICYDKPPNLKSFIQRRGRARQKESTYAILTSTMDETAEMRKWQVLEKDMIEAYQDQQRQMREAIQIESIDENVSSRIVVPSTGAVITPDNVLAHLYHFCAVLPDQQYVDNKPTFSFEKNDSLLVQGTVILPNSVHPDVRRAQGTRWWKTERAATKESAIIAYRALYEFGLLSDHLLPLTQTPELKQSNFGTAPSIVKEASGQYDPFTAWAWSWSSPDIHRVRVSLRRDGQPNDELSFIMMTPTILPQLEPISLFWDRDTTFTLSFGVPERNPTVTADNIENMRSTTALYLGALRRKQFSPQDYVVLFSPDVVLGNLAGWLDGNVGYEPASQVYSRGDLFGVTGAIRDNLRGGEPFLFRKWTMSDIDGKPALKVECSPIPRRRNFLQPLTPGGVQCDGADDPEASSPKLHEAGAESCSVSRLPLSHGAFGLFIPIIVQQLENMLVEARLCNTILKDVGFARTRHVRTAITTPSANPWNNYQRYEFLGDSILKYAVSSQLFFARRNWHEGYLTEARNVIVQNPRLTRAALDNGLDAFILMHRYSPRKWEPPLISTGQKETPETRSISSKVLADVVEALIGAAYLDGGFARAQKCMHRLLPEIHEQPPDILSFTNSRHVDQPNPQQLMNDSLSKQLGYTFKNQRLLVEALTHPSCQHDSSTQSYQRLEFLGDAVLDMVIVQAIFQHPATISPGRMTLVKHAVNNANLLAFLAMEYTVTQEKQAVVQTPDDKFTTQPETESLELWRFMRYNSPALQRTQTQVLDRHRALRDEIITAFQTSSHYPWQPLAQINADKWFSDLVESILGAIFVDSGGDLVACEAFVESIGLLKYLRRILANEIVVRHPKNVALQVAQRLAQRSLVGDYDLIVKRVPDENGASSFRCTVMVSGEPVILVEGCPSQEEAEIRAANQAIEYLQRLEQNSTGGKEAVEITMDENVGDTEKVESSG